jgi:hypothetical protein
VLIALGASSRAQTRKEYAASKSIEFRSVRDNVPFGLRDTAAFVKLLKQTRDTQPADLAKNDQTDLILREIPQRSDRFRGAPLRVKGIARRLYSSQSPITAGNRLYEVWITTGRKDPDPIACLVEELPPGFPDRPVISEPVAVRGFFLKLMAYKVGDKPFVAPLMVGALERRPKPDENIIEPPADEVFVRIPDGLESRSVGPPVEEKLSLKLERSGRLTIDGEVVPKNGLARKLETLADTIRFNIRSGGVLLPSDRELPVPLTLRAPDDTPSVVICKLMLDCQNHGFLKYTLELESGHDPPVGYPADAANASRTRNADGLSDDDRTIKLRIGADLRGRIGQFQLGRRTLQGTDALSRELTAILNDPNVPYDRASVELDPRLKYSEMVRVTRLLSNPAMTSVRLTPTGQNGRN